MKQEKLNIVITSLMDNDLLLYGTIVNINDRVLDALIEAEGTVELDRCEEEEWDQSDQNEIDSLTLDMIFEGDYDDYVVNFFYNDKFYNWPLLNETRYPKFFSEFSTWTWEKVIERET